jgi:hypothetical protein
MILVIAEDYRMAFDVNMIVNTEGWEIYSFILFFIYFLLLLMARRVREQH